VGLFLFFGHHTGDTYTHPHVKEKS